MLSLIASLGGWTKFCFVPRYLSVVWTDAWPSSSLDLLNKLTTCGPADPINSSRIRTNDQNKVRPFAYRCQNGWARCFSDAVP